MGENASFTMFLEINSRRIPLESYQLYMIGKLVSGDDNNVKRFIKLQDEDVEDKHCVIEVRHSEDVCVYDLFSSKGTFVNDTHLKALEKVRLKNGDILKLGKEDIKYVNEHRETSHDSSGFLEVNKNTSDIIASSPENNQQHESRIKRLNNNNFLVPLIPSRKSNCSTNSFNASTDSNNRRSDSFTIPETQYCKPRNSLNVLDHSIAESITDISTIKQKSNISYSGELDDHEFCIPETQEVVSVTGITNSQRSHIITDAIENSILQLDPPNVSDGGKDNDGSQFRICTQDYNDGFGEEAEVGLHSQVIPLIKYSTVILNNSSKICKEKSKNKSSIEEEDKDMLNIEWSNMKTKSTSLRADCSTPDLFNFGVDNVLEQVTKENKDKDKSSLNTSFNMQDENEDDLLLTQMFPTTNAKQEGKISLKDLESPCIDKENEEILTLSDKENCQPISLQAPTHLNPTQLFVTNEELSTSTSSFRINLIDTALKTNTVSGLENKNNPKSLINMDPDKDDELLTQIFLQPTTLRTTNSNTDEPVNCFNSTVLEGKFLAKNSALFFDEMEKTPLKQNSASPAFKIAQKDFAVLNINGSATNTTSESDLDMLMCTPQLIKEHLYMDKTEDLRKNILAVKSSHLFDDDKNEEEAKEDDGQSDLVKLINIPKDSLDFDQLLPHLKTKQKRSKISEKQKAVEEASKQYKFNISFGNEQTKKETNLSKSSTFSRDERHAARDKEKELNEHKTQPKTKGTSNRTKGKSQEKKTRQKETETVVQKEHKSKLSVEKDESTLKEQEKQDKSTRLRKRQLSTYSDAKEPQIEETTKLLPAKRITRAKSRFEENPTSSKESTKSKKSKDSQDGKDDLDSISTQPFARITRCSSSSKQSESPDRVSSKCSERKAHEHKNIKNDSSLSYNTSANGNISMKTSNERKRKAETTQTIAPVKIETKRLRHTNSAESFTHSSPSYPVKISMTMVNQELFKDLVKDCKGFWSVVKNPADSEVLVMDSAFRTFKFLLALARGIPIVSSGYLKKLNQSQLPTKVQINDYLFCNDEFEKKYKFSLAHSLNLSKKHKLFEGYQFVMTASILPNPQEIKAIIEASGGLVSVKPAPPAHKVNQKIYLVTSLEDKKDWHKYRRINKNIVIVSTEAIMTAIMRQTCECMSSYTLS